MDFGRIKAYEMGTKYFVRDSIGEKKGEYFTQTIGTGGLFTSKDEQEIARFQPLLSGGLYFSMTISRPDDIIVGATTVIEIYQGDTLISELTQGMAGTVERKTVTIAIEVEALKTYRVVARLTSGDSRKFSGISVNGRVCTKPSNYIIVK